jgi:hypothetical protein
MAGAYPRVESHKGYAPVGSNLTANSRLAWK